MRCRGSWASSYERNEKVCSAMPSISEALSLAGRLLIYGSAQPIVASHTLKLEINP